MKARIKMDPLLHERAAAHAAALGYSSVDEFISHLVERELTHQADAKDDDAVADRLRGLGYLS